MAKERGTPPPSPIEKKQTRRLLIVLVMISAFFVAELIGARIAKSDVLEADAFHLLMDVLAIAISLGAMRVATRRPNARFTFGLRRAEPLAAMANGVLVLGLVTELVRHGIEHLAHPETPNDTLVIAVASAALVVNIINAWLLHGAMGHKHDGHDHAHGHGHAHGHHLNMRGAWLHLLGDALGSVAAFISGAAIRFGAPPIVDPLASFVVVLILLVGALRLLRDAGYVLLEAAPARLDVTKIEEFLLLQEGIEKIHALHVWSLGTGHDAITVHVVAKNASGGALSEKLREEFAAEYVTVQVDTEEAKPHAHHDHAHHDHHDHDHDH